MPRELIAVVDLETTGLDEKKDRVIEAALALVDVETAQVVEFHSELYHSDTNEAELARALGAGEPEDVP